MTIEEAIIKIQGKPAGVTARASVRYAQEQLEKDEKVFAAATANIHTHRGHFPGVLVLTGQRVCAACGLPGIHRLKSFPIGEITSCSDKKSPMEYKVSFGTDSDSFQAVLSSRAGENFAPFMSDLKKVLLVKGL